MEQAGQTGQRLVATAALAPGPARQQSIRAANLALALRLIRESSTPLSRAALAAATGMTRATASALADSLLASGLAAEVDPPPASGAGRPAAGLVAAPSGPAGLGLEINVDNLAACVTDLSGAVRHREVRHADLRGRAPESVFDDLASLADAAIAAVSATHQVAGVALAVPGLVDHSTGRILRAPNLDWRGVDTVAILKPRLPGTPLALAIGNEADFAAEGELHLDAELTDFLYVSGEIGVGAGIVFGRRIFTGSRGWSGEIGHVTVDPTGRACRCGARGCLETVAGQEALDNGQSLESAGTALGVAVAATLNILDLDTVVLGGVYAKLPDLAPIVERELAEHVVSAAWSPIRVLTSRADGPAAALGASASVTGRIHADPAGWEALG
jgi:predicted NBD/HSP70 family sugar kinase